MSQIFHCGFFSHSCNSGMPPFHTGYHVLIIYRRLSTSFHIDTTVFHAKIYTILACVYEIPTTIRLEIYNSICSDSLAALKALQPVKTMYPLVWHCQRVLDDLYTHHLVTHLGSWTFWCNCKWNSNKFAKEGSAHQFVGPQRTLGISGKNIRHIIKGWLFKQYMTLWDRVCGFLSPQHGASSGCRWRNGLQNGRQLWINWISSRGQRTRGGPPAWGVGEALTTPPREKQHVKKYSSARCFLWRQNYAEVKYSPTRISGGGGGCF